MSSRIDDLIDQYQIARAMSWRYRLDGFEAEALKSILATYDAARAEIMRDFDRFAQLTDWRSDRLEDILGEVEAMTAGLRQELTGQYGSMMTQVGSASAAEAVAALSLGGHVAVNNIALSPTQLRQFFVDMPICGHKLTRWVNASFDATMQQGIREAINTGVIKGEGYPGLVKRVQEGYGLARNEATTLTRTFVSAANNAAREETYKANDDVVKGWKWITAGDNLVCMMCLPLHGRTFKLGEGPDIPRHPRCRCCHVPQTISWRELGLDIDEFQSEADQWIVRGKVGKDGEITVNPVGTGGANPILKISHHSDAQGWYDSLSDTEKRSTGLGPGRIKLLDEGKIKITDLIDHNYNVRTIKQLEAL